MNNIGTHMIIDLHNVDFMRIQSYNVIKMEKFFISLLTSYGCNIFDAKYHYFSKDERAFTGFLLLGESHFSIHTWPEKKYVSMDMFSCNINKDMSTCLGKIFDQIIAEFFDNLGIDEKRQILYR